MNVLARVLAAAALVGLAACASPAPDTIGPANERSFPATFDRVWEAAQRAVPGAWGQGVRTVDSANGVLIFNPRVVASRPPANRMDEERATAGGRLLSPGQVLGQNVSQQLSVYVSRGGGSSTLVTLRLDTDVPSAAGEDNPDNDRMARKILDAVDKELKK